MDFHKTSFLLNIVESYACFKPLTSKARSLHGENENEIIDLKPYCITQMGPQTIQDQK